MTLLGIYPDELKIAAAVQLLTCVRLLATPWTQHARLPCPSLSPWVCSNSCALSQWCHTAISSSVVPFSSCPQSFPVSGSFPIGWPKYWSFSINPSNIYSELISFRIDWFYILAYQGTLKSLLWHHNLEVSVFWGSAFFMVQLSYPHITTIKTIALITWTFVGKAISLLFNMLSRFVIGFLPRSKCLNFIAAVTLHSDFGDQENKICHCFYFSPIYLPWNDGIGCLDLCFLNAEF